MIVKTKKYELEKKKYVNLSMRQTMMKLWWSFLIPFAIASLTFVQGSNWWWIIGLILFVLYTLFWYIQFNGITQLPQYSMLFERYSYEINSQQIMMKKNAREGMPIQWAQIKKATKSKDAFVFVISRGQFIYLPFKIFNSQNDLKFVEAIMKRKGLLKEGAQQSS